MEKVTDDVTLPDLFPLILLIKMTLCTRVHRQYPLCSNGLYFNIAKPAVDQVIIIAKYLAY